MSSLSFSSKAGSNPFNSVLINASASASLIGIFVVSMVLSNTHENSPRIAQCGRRFWEIEAKPLQTLLLRAIAHKTTVFRVRLVSAECSKTIEITKALPAFVGLITQRLVVQIHPPQPTES